MKYVKIVFAILVISPLFWLSNSTGPLPGNTGAPGEFTCGRAPCHNIPINTGSAEITVNLDENSEQYIPGATHEVTISLLNSPTVRNGFQILALDENNQNAGFWLLRNTQQTQIISGFSSPSKKYATHLRPGTELDSWTFDWRAPNEDVGNITFYLSVLASNNNGENTGDTLYNISKTFTFAEPNAVSTPAPENIWQAFPNPAKDFLYVENLTAKPIGGQILNARGQQVKFFTLSSGNNQLFTQDLAPGLYLLQIQVNNRTFAKKIIIQ